MPPLTTNPHHEASGLVPIRVDVFNDAKNLRVVDTILLDTASVWPVPLDDDHVEASLDANAWYLAQSVLQDCEVSGMGRTVRHYTGRLELWSWNLLQKVRNNILPQLQVAYYGSKNKIKSPAAIRPVSVKKPISLQRKRYEDESLEGGGSEEPAKKRRKVDAEGGGEAVAEAGGDEDDPATKSHGDEPPTVTSAEPTTAASEQPDKSAANADDAPKKPTTATTKKLSSSHHHSSNQHARLIPIHIRMSVHGIRIHDDLWWDPSMADVVNPLQLAQQIGDDLRLAPEAVQAVACSIVEQIHGSPLLPDEAAETDEGGPPGNRSKTTAAWPLEQRVHITNVAHLVAQHRPPSNTAAAGTPGKS